MDLETSDVECVSNGVGVLISGTTKDSPVQQAGFQKGDILIEMKGVKIDDVYDFTDVLQTLVIEEKIKAKVQRPTSNVKTVVLEVVPGVKK